jgi:hypothetical protein
MAFLPEDLARDRDQAFDASVVEPAQWPAHVELDVIGQGDPVPLGSRWRGGFGLWR